MGSSLSSLSFVYLALGKIWCFVIIIIIIILLKLFIASEGHKASSCSLVTTHPVVGQSSASGILWWWTWRNEASCLVLFLQASSEAGDSHEYRADKDQGEGPRMLWRWAEWEFGSQSPTEPPAVTIGPARCSVWLPSLCVSFQNVCLQSGTGPLNSSYQWPVWHLWPSWPLSVSKRATWASNGIGGSWRRETQCLFLQQGFNAGPSGLQGRAGAGGERACLPGMKELKHKD